MTPDLQRWRRLTHAGDVDAARTLLIEAQRRGDHRLAREALRALALPALRELDPALVDDDAALPVGAVRPTAWAVAPDASLVAIAEGHLVHLFDVHGGGLEARRRIRCNHPVVALACCRSDDGASFVVTVDRASTRAWLDVSPVGSWAPATRVQAPVGFERAAVVTTDGSDSILMPVSRGRVAEVRPTLGGRLLAAHPRAGLVVRRTTLDAVTIEAPDATESMLPIQRAIRDWRFSPDGRRAICVDSGGWVHWLHRTDPDPHGLELWRIAATFGLESSTVPSLSWPAQAPAGAAIVGQDHYVWRTPGGPAEIDPAPPGRFTDAPGLAAGLRGGTFELTRSGMGTPTDGASEPHGPFGTDGASDSLSPPEDERTHRALGRLEAIADLSSPRPTIRELHLSPDARRVVEVADGSLTLRSTGGAWPRHLLHTRSALVCHGTDAIWIADHSTNGECNLRCFSSDGSQQRWRPIPDVPRAIWHVGDAIWLLVRTAVDDTLGVLELDAETLVERALLPVRGRWLGGQTRSHVAPDGSLLVATSSGSESVVVDLVDRRGDAAWAWASPVALRGRKVAQLRGGSLELIDVSPTPEIVARVDDVQLRGGHLTVSGGGRYLLGGAGDLMLVWRVGERSLEPVGVRYAVQWWAVSAHHDLVVVGSAGQVLVTRVDRLDRVLCVLPDASGGRWSWTPDGTGLVRTCPGGDDPRQSRQFTVVRVESLIG